MREGQLLVEKITSRQKLEKVKKIIFAQKWPKHESGNLNSFCDEQVHHYIDMGKCIIIEINVMITIRAGARQVETRS